MKTGSNTINNTKTNHDVRLEFTVILVLPQNTGIGD